MSPWTPLKRKNEAALIQCGCNGRFERTTTAPSDTACSCQALCWCGACGSAHAVQYHPASCCIPCVGCTIGSGTACALLLLLLLQAAACSAWGRAYFCCLGRFTPYLERERFLSFTGEASYAPRTTR